MQVKIAKREILLVEDNPTYAQTLTQIIEDLMEHNVTYVPTGEQAVRMVEQIRFDLILLDMNLPGIQGWEVAEAIRKLDGYATVPIIAMTAYDDVGKRKQSLAAGCNVYLIKPIDVDALEELMTLYLRGFS